MSDGRGRQLSVVNTSRGAIVSTDALVSAVRSGCIAGFQKGEPIRVLTP